MFCSGKLLRRSLAVAAAWMLVISSSPCPGRMVESRTLRWAHCVVFLGGSISNGGRAWLPVSTLFLSSLAESCACTASVHGASKACVGRIGMFVRICLHELDFLCYSTSPSTGVTVSYRPYMVRVPPVPPREGTDQPTLTGTGISSDLCLVRTGQFGCPGGKRRAQVRYYESSCLCSSFNDRKTFCSNKSG